MKLSTRYLSITETYIFANEIILFVALLVFLYPLFTPYFNGGFSCQHMMLFGTECRSCGLTRGLTSCMKLDFSTANKFNAQSAFIFVCVICQVIFRFLLIRIAKIKLLLRQTIKLILLLDISTLIIILTIDLKYYG
jgi:hypothetical protein